MAAPSKKTRAVRFPQRHCHMPSGVLFDVIEGRLTDTDLRVAAALGTMSENHWIKDTRQARIAERCGLRRETVSRAIKRLQEVGWLEVVDPGRPSGILTYLLLYDRRPLQEGPDAEEGEPESQGQQGEDGGGVRVDAQGEGVCVATHRGGVRQLDHTPCDPSAHTYTNPSSKEDSPLPPLPAETRPAACTGPDGPDASADGGSADAPGSGQRLSLSAQAMVGGRAQVSGNAAPAATPPQGQSPIGAGDRRPPGTFARTDGAEAPEDQQKQRNRGCDGTVRARPETTPGPDGLDGAAFRAAMRKAVGQERWVSRFARLRVVNGWLVCLSWGDAACLWRDFEPVLKQAGVSVIWAEHEQREVRP